MADSESQKPLRGKMIDIEHPIDEPYTTAPWSGYGHLTGRDNNQPPPTEASGDDRTLG